MADEGGPADKDWVPTADEVEEDKRDEETVPAAASKRKPSNVDAMKKNLLDRLKAYFDENDVLFEDGWRVEVKQRTGGSSAGTSDAYYYNPEGKRFRSRAEIAREYGISVEKTGGRNAAPRKPLVLLPRVDALAAVQARSVLAVLPLKTSGGVTVTSYGTIKPEYTTETSLAFIGYTAVWTDKRGVKFTSTITDTGHGPYYSVRAALASSQAAPVEVGSGLNPDAAWAAAEERQQELMEAKREGEGGHEDEEMDAADTLLARAAPLTGCWGTERYGFIDVPVLQALEAQPGVPSTSYKFVEERSSWDEENRRLMREAAAHTRAAGGAGPARPQAKQRPRTTEERNKAAVARVVEGMVRQLEAMEAKSEAAAQRAMAKREREAARQMEKEQRRLAKEREREIAKRLHEQQRELARQQAAEAARRAAEAARTFPDQELEGAGAPPPAPGPLLSGRAPPSAEPALLEAWHLLHAFSDLIGVDRSTIPPLASLEAALIEVPAPGGDAMVTVVSSLVNFLVGSLFERCAEAICNSQADVPDKDLRVTSKPPFKHPVPINPDTWQEAARRYLAVVADTAACLAHQEEGRGGLPYPSDHLEDWLILQYLLAAPPSALARGWGALPKGSSDHAWLGDTARCDAAALAAASPATPGSATETAIRLQRCILRQLATLRGERGRSGKVLCFMGHAAAAATKHGRSLDLRYVGARVDAGVYAAAPDPLAAFVADVRFVLELHAAAASKRQSGFADLTKDKGVDEVCAMVSSKLDAILDEVAASGAEAYLAAHAPPVTQPVIAWREARAAAQKAAAEPGADAEALLAGYESENEPIPVSDPVNDLGRPFAPWEGCGVCWDDVDDARMLMCSKCSAPFHTYCLDPPVAEIPEEDWLCPGCGPQPAAPAPRFPVGSGAQAVWDMAQRLASGDYGSWDVGQRAALLRLLCMLVADSPQLRDLLVGEEKDAADKRKELHARQKELKNKQAEEAAAAAAPPAAEGDAAPADAEAQPAATRRSREDAAADIQSLVERISALEAEVAATTPHAPRLEPLGFDRHWNRYWALPAEALGDDPLGPGAVVVERSRLDGAGAPGWSPAQGPPGEWEVGMYVGTDALNALIGWLNPKGEREKALCEALKTERTRQGVRAAELERRRKEELLEARIAQAEGRDPLPSTADKEKPEEAMEVDTAPSAERLRAKLLSTEQYINPAARHELFGSDEAMEAWRARVAAASTPAEFMACLITLERGIRADYLKTHWRPWSMVAPNPTAAGTLAAPWLRLEALRDAISNTVRIKKTAAVAAGQGPRYPKREKRSAGPDSGVDSGAESDGGRAAREARAAKRSRPGSEEPVDDEELARRLHAELNAPEGRKTSRLRQSSRAEDAAARRDAEKRAAHSLREHARVSYKEEDDDEEEYEEDADEEMEEATAGAEEEEEEEESAGGGDGDDYQPSAEED